MLHESIKIVGKRNPTILVEDSINPLKIKTIGDPHLGRKFYSNVPKTRLGEREELVYLDFQNQITNLEEGTTDVVIMGDLFDKTNVSNECLLRTVEIIEAAAKENIEVEYTILAGNHDLVKDKNKKSTFDVFKDRIENSNPSNITIATTILHTTVYFKDDLTATLLFIPYLPYVGTNNESLYEQIDLAVNTSDIVIAFGHWDVEDFNTISGTINSIERSIPDYFIDNCDLIITGHEHRPRLLTLKNENNSSPLVVTGSMQPYAFGEQLNDELIYTTTTLVELNNHLELSNTYYKNCNVRVLLTKEDTYPELFECLSLSYKYTDPVATKNDDTAILNDSASVSTISFHSLFTSNIDELKLLDGVDQSLLKDIEEAFLNKDYSKD